MPERQPARFTVKLTEGQLAQVNLTEAQWTLLRTIVTLGKLIIDKETPIANTVYDLRDMALIEFITSTKPESPIYSICMPTLAGIARCVGHTKLMSERYPARLHGAAALAEMLWNARVSTSDKFPAWTAGLTWDTLGSACTFMPAAKDLRRALLFQAEAMRNYLGYAGWSAPAVPAPVPTSPAEDDGAS